MVRVEVQVAEGVDKLAGLQPRDLRHHQREQRVAGDVEGHTQEEVRAALVELATQLAVGHVELEQRVAGREFHLVNLPDVPRADDVPARVGVPLKLCDDLVNLVHAAAVGRAPVAPLRAIDAAEVAVGVGPFVPDGHAALLQPLYVRLAAQEPEQFVEDGLEMKLLRGEGGETRAQVEARLRAEDGVGPGAGAVGLELAFVEDVLEQVEIWLHEGRTMRVAKAGGQSSVVSRPTPAPASPAPSPA